jgi:hypothetical protein
MDASELNKMPNTPVHRRISSYLNNEQEEEAAHVSRTSCDSNIGRFGKGLLEVFSEDSDLARTVNRDWLYVTQTYQHQCN